MTDYSTNFFGASIDTAEITDGAVTLAKLDRTGITQLVLTAQGAGNTPVWSSAGSMVKIGTQSLALAGTTFSFTSIPAGYSKFIANIVATKDSSAPTSIILRLNNDSTGGNYFNQFVGCTTATITTLGIYGNYDLLAGIVTMSNAAATTHINLEIFNSPTGYRKSIFVQCCGNDATSITSCGSWFNTTDTINRIDVIADQNFKVGSTMTLWGVV